MLDKYRRTVNRPTVFYIVPLLKWICWSAHRPLTETEVGPICALQIHAISEFRRICFYSKTWTIFFGRIPKCYNGSNGCNAALVSEANRVHGSAYQCGKGYNVSYLIPSSYRPSRKSKTAQPADAKFCETDWSGTQQITALGWAVAPPICAHFNITVDCLISCMVSRSQDGAQTFVTTRWTHFIQGHAFLGSRWCHK